MAPLPRWITVSASSALGLGIMAAGAVGVANAIPLVDSTTSTEVPPISTVRSDATDDVKGLGDALLPITLPSSAPAAAPTQQPPATQQQPATPPQPVAPVAPDSVSPASVNSVD